MARKRKPRKGTLVAPYKGGRTERLYARMTPEAIAALRKILSCTGESVADWAERHIYDEESKTTQ